MGNTKSTQSEIHMQTLNSFPQKHTPTGSPFLNSIVPENIDQEAIEPSSLEILEERTKVSSPPEHKLRSNYLYKLGLAEAGHSPIKNTKNIPRLAQSSRFSSEDKIKASCEEAIPKGFNRKTLKSADTAASLDIEESVVGDEEEEIFSEDETASNESLTPTSYALNDSMMTFVQKSADEMRTNYLKKLVYNRVWKLPHEKPKFHKTVIIFDWDDTLMCTSYLNPDGTGSLERKELPHSVQEQINKLEDVVLKVLQESQKHGQVYIITNAAPGWVEISAKMYFPKTVEEIKKIKIISARGFYENMYPGDTKQWKIQAFLKTQEDLQETAVTNLLALGDSDIEINAAYHLAQMFSNAIIKTVKLRQFPSPLELYKQLLQISENLAYICTHGKSLKISLRRKTKEDH